MDDEDSWRLRIPSKDALSELDNQIDVGRSLLSRTIGGPEELNEWRRNFRSWDRQNLDLLELLFVSAEAANEYRASGIQPVSEAVATPDPRQEMDDLRDSITDRLDQLQSVRRRIVFLSYTELQGQDAETPPKAIPIEADEEKVIRPSAPIRTQRPTRRPLRQASRQKSSPHLTVTQYNADTSSDVDLVGIESDVNAFAYLLTARDLEPPLAIGLFGDWGSGKTFFMRFLQRQVEAITAAAQASGSPQRKIAVYKRIIQIEFNAWNYVEGNLWASLVEHIFSNLRTSASEHETVIEDRRKRLGEGLESTQQEYRAAESLVKILRDEVARKKSEVQDLQVEQQKRLASINEAKLTDLLRNINLTEDDREEIQASLREVGLTGVGQQASDLVQSVADARETIQRGNALITPMRQPNGWRWALMVVLAIMVGPAVSWIISRFDVSSATNVAATIGAFLTALTAIVKRGTSWLNSAIAKVEQADQRLKAKIDEVNRDAAERTAKLEIELSALSQRQHAAEEEVRAAQQRITEIQSRLSRLTPAQLLADFIAERAESGDYRRLLGLTAIIRRDFEQLSQLIEDYNNTLLNDESHEGNDGGADFNRIILYIDDLDRCPPERVVEVLQAIHLLLAFPLFVVVVAVDARWLAQSLSREYRGLLAGPAVRGSLRGYTPGATAQDYLEKIFQIPFWVRPLDLDTRLHFVQGLFSTMDIRATGGLEERSPAGTVNRDQQPVQERSLPIDGAVGKESIGETTEAPVVLTREPAVNLNPDSLSLQSEERRFMESVVPLLGRSPRAVKRFLNTYRLMKAISLSSGREFITSEEFSDFKISMLLLAIVTGLPNISARLFNIILDAQSGDGPMNGQGARDIEVGHPVTLGSIMESESILDWPEELADDLNHLRAWMDDNEDWKAIHVEAMTELIGIVSRYSFRGEVEY
jgi:hypothetical protein